MGAVEAGLLALGALIALIALRVPIAFALGSVGVVGLWQTGGPELTMSVLKTLPYGVTSEYAFVVVPMFILMGAVASEAGLTTDLYTALYKCFSRIRGSLYVVTTLASAGFAAISGSTVVNAVVFTRVALPEMIRLNYHKGFGAGCIAAAGTFAALIPPSISMVVVAIITDESIGALLIAGILPGLLTAGIYVAGILVFVRIRPGIAGETAERFGWSERGRALARIWPVALLSLVVLGGIYSGVMFPSSAGAVGAVGAIVIALAQRRLTGASFWEALRSTAATTGVLLAIIIGGLLFSRMLVISGFIGEFTAMVVAFGVEPWTFLLGIVLIYLLLGMFVDSLSMIVVTLPFLYPVAVQLGIDTIWFAVVIVKLIELSTITPPVGLNLYALLSAAKGQVDVRDVFVGVLPFILLEIVALALIVAFPALSTWLPATMMG